MKQKHKSGQLLPMGDVSPAMPQRGRDASAQTRRASRGPSIDGIIQRETDLFRALAHPARLAILHALVYEEACVCHLEALLGYRQAYLSQQLAALRSAGLVQDRRDGWNVYYRIRDTRLLSVLDAARDLLGVTEIGELGQTDQTSQAASAPVPGCACPHCAPGAPGEAHVVHRSVLPRTGRQRARNHV